MSTQVELPMRKALEWQMAGRNDMGFAMHLIRFFIEEEFLVNPDPDLRTIEMEVTNHTIVFRKLPTEET